MTTQEKVNPMINPHLSLFIITLLIITSVILVFLKKYKYIISLLVLTLIFIGSNYWYFNQQGATNIFNNPIDMLQSSKLAPKPNQIANIKDLTAISDSDKEHTIFIIYKFGCPHCQQLWLFANHNNDLLPSKNVKWIPTSEENKNKSDLINQVNSYPAIIYWDKIDNQFKEKISIQPSESELNGILTRLKEYKK
jgi:hypothetical protein